MVKQTIGERIASWDQRTSEGIGKFMGNVGDFGGLMGNIGKDVLNRVGESIGDFARGFAIEQLYSSLGILGDRPAGYLNEGVNYDNFYGNEFTAKRTGVRLGFAVDLLTLSAAIAGYETAQTLWTLKGSGILASGFYEAGKINESDSQIKVRNSYAAAGIKENVEYDIRSAKKNNRSPRNLRESKDSISAARNRLEEAEGLGIESHLAVVQAKTLIKEAEKGHLSGAWIEAHKEKPARDAELEARKENARIIVAEVAIL